MGEERNITPKINNDPNHVSHINHNSIDLKDGVGMSGLEQHGVGVSCEARKPRPSGAEHTAAAAFAAERLIDKGLKRRG
ncbi:hypothetical protein NDU88_004817 [Pleurodeles waltl]|uniref:Uncharacterized protein n=1 Tax=Pleurodeles waltl TaxID=8319 RepID=A0AAV7MUZ4_PLEWA|nr:hypothetical protein NDU88_004817 [Pleurodeles waltl]